MKKPFFILFIFILFSCNKKKQNWECHCEIHTPAGHQSQVKYFDNQTKTNAANNCDDVGKDQAGSTGSFTCSIQAY